MVLLHLLALSVSVVYAFVLETCRCNLHAHQAFVCVTIAANIFIQVADPLNDDNTTTFNPQRVAASIGDIVFFNCTPFLHLIQLPGRSMLNHIIILVTNGNHSAVQSTFPGPCVPAHDSDSTINGFDSGFRPNPNGTVVPTPILSVPILSENVGTPFWFFDASPGACGGGAVGVINSNENGNETLAGFIVSGAEGVLIETNTCCLEKCHTHKWHGRRVDNDLYLSDSFCHTIGLVWCFGISTSFGVYLCRVFACSVMLHPM